MRIRAIGAVATLLLSFSAAAFAAPTPSTRSRAPEPAKAEPSKKPARASKTQARRATEMKGKGRKVETARSAKASKVKPTPVVVDHHPPEPQDIEPPKASLTKPIGKAGLGGLPKLPALKAEASMVITELPATPMKPSCLRPPVTFVRGTEESTFSLTRCDGASAPLAVEKLSVVARAGAQKPADPITELAKKAKGALLAPGIRKLDPRLVEQLQLVIDHFAKAGKAIKVHLVSGFRPNASGSYHASGRALDFRLEGIENEKLVAFCKTLSDVGCGYYPNSTFVHMDVREQGTGHVSWIDASGPGEAARYVDVWPPRKDAKPRFLESLEDGLARLDRGGAPQLESRGGAVGLEAAKVLGLVGFGSDAVRKPIDRGAGQGPADDDKAAEAPAAALTLPIDAE